MVNNGEGREAFERKNTWVIIAIALALFWVVMAVRDDEDEAPTRAPLTAEERADIAAIGRRNVTYRVEGTARKAMVTMMKPTGMAQSVVDLPMRNKSGTEGIRFTTDRGDFLVMSAQNQDSSGSVTCIIEVDGQEISRNTSSGAYVIASCEASA